MAAVIVDIKIWFSVVRKHFRISTDCPGKQEDELLHFVMRASNYCIHSSNKKIASAKWWKHYKSTNSATITKDCCLESRLLPNASSIRCYIVQYKQFPQTSHMEQAWIRSTPINTSAMLPTKLSSSIAIPSFFPSGFVSTRMVRWHRQSSGSSSPPEWQARSVAASQSGSRRRSVLSCR